MGASRATIAQIPSFFFKFVTFDILMCTGILIGGNEKSGSSQKVIMKRKEGLDITVFLKILCWFGSVFFAVAGWVFAASFALDELQSWGKALFVARTVPIGSILCAMTLGIFKRRWIYTSVSFILLASGALGIGAITFLAESPTDPVQVVLHGPSSMLFGLSGEFYLCISGIVTTTLASGLLANTPYKFDDRPSAARHRRLCDLPFVSSRNN